MFPNLKQVTAAACSLLLFACEPSPRDSGGSVVQVAPGENYTHPTAAILYPPSIANFRRNHVELRTEEGALGPAVYVEYDAELPSGRVQVDTLVHLWIPTDTPLSEIAPHCYEAIYEKVLDKTVSYQLSRNKSWRDVLRSDYRFLQSGINITAKRASLVQPYRQIVDPAELYHGFFVYSRGLHQVFVHASYLITPDSVEAAKADLDAAEYEIKQFLESWDTAEFDLGQTQAEYDAIECTCCEESATET